MAERAGIFHCDTFDTVDWSRETLETFNWPAWVEQETRQRQIHPKGSVGCAPADSDTGLPARYSSKKWVFASSAGGHLHYLRVSLMLACRATKAVGKRTRRLSVFINYNHPRSRPQSVQPLRRSPAPIRGPHCLRHQLSECSPLF